MGKFDGILIASDWDGTVYCNGVIPEDNIKAIRYFQDNGGKFTICSGRYSDFLEAFSDKISANTYLICYNGAYIANTKSGEILYKGFLDGHLFDILELVYKSGKPIDHIRFSLEGDAPTLIAKTWDEYREKLSLIKKSQIHKTVVVYLNEDDAVDDKRILEKSGILDDYMAVRSWNVGLELIKHENSKGIAVRRVAEREKSKLVVTAGDYENDIELLRSADIGYAVMNSTPALKEVADRVTVSAYEGAIAKIIYEIEEELNLV